MGVRGEGEGRGAEEDRGDLVLSTRAAGLLHQREGFDGRGKSRERWRGEPSAIPAGSVDFFFKN